MASTLAPGARLGIYEIVDAIGEGGMGEVYRASDTRLNRDVAIKILPDAVAQDVERLARFKREAQVLAALSHPSIGAIYGLDDADGRPFLVLELIDGETLAERIARGALPVQDALAAAIQIADALEAAHEKGIIHRDLKPANVKISSEGKVKVLDFGLAKAMDAKWADSGAERGHLTHSPTLSLMATEAGMILGTAAYMSPEQAKGFPTDQRTDVFSFGCVLYEMLTGLKVFNADTAPETLAAVLMRDPDLNVLPPALHPGLRRLLARCLEKNPKKRWQAIGDVRYEIEAIVADPQAGSSTTTAAASAASTMTVRPLWKRALPVLLTAIVVAGGAIAVERLRPVTPAPVVRFPFVLPDDQSFTTVNSGNLAVSPDGTRVVYVANRQLYLRAIGDMEARPIPGTQLNVAYPFFSPDGQWIGFASAQDGALKKIAITGGASVTLCTLDTSDTGIQGASWDEDAIVFAVNGKGILRVSPNGGEPEVIARTSESEAVYGPQLLPGGKDVLYTRTTSESGRDRWDKGQIVAQTIGTNERKIVVKGGSAARYIPATGHLVYALGTTLLAVPFDARRMDVRGGPIPVVEHVARSRNSAIQSAVAHFAVTPSGALAYIVGVPGAEGTAPVALALVERSGAIHQLELPAQPYLQPRLSPDGRQLAVGTADGKEANIWVYDLKAGGSLRRLTFGGRNLFPIWSPDGRYIAYQSDRDGDPGIFRQLADGSGAAERLTRAEAGTRHEPEGWSPDGTTLSFNMMRGVNQGVWTVAVSGDRKPAPFVDTANTEKHSTFSPNGKWLAYMETAVNMPGTQVYVQPFPATGAKYLVPSDSGARAPAWSRDGRQLFYHDSASNRFSVVDVQMESGSLTFGKPTVLPIEGTIHPVTQRNYDVTPDGKQLLVVLPAAPAGKASAARPVQQINVVLNWFQELNARVPTK
jgi:serine/threonine-protein kinase